MAVINTGLLAKGLRSEFFRRLVSVQTYYQDWSTHVSSTTDHEDYRWLGTVPQMRAWGQGRLARGLRSESYTVANQKYEATLEVDRDELSDDQTGQISVRIRELAERAATHKDVLLSEMLVRGEQELGFDGVPFFSDQHESGRSGAQDNRLKSDAADKENPTVEEFRDSMRQAVGAILGFKDDRGEPMSLRLSGFVCVVPPSMLFTAMEAVNASVIRQTTNIMQGVASVASFPYLTDPTRYFLLKTDGTVRPFIFQDREPIEFTSLTDQSDESFRREKYLFGVRARYRMAYAYWQYAVQMEFSNR